jgi:hypothetical protein
MSSIQRVIANPVVIPASIKLGESQSSAIPMGGRTYIAITTPPAWTAAAVTFLASNEEGGTFLPVHKEDGTELTITSANFAVNRNIGLGTAFMQYLSAFKFIKIRSGNTATPVNQLAARPILIHTK